MPASYLKAVCVKQISFLSTMSEEMKEVNQVKSLKWGPNFRPWSQLMVLIKNRKQNARAVFDWSNLLQALAFL